MARKVEAVQEKLRAMDQATERQRNEERQLKLQCDDRRAEEGRLKAQIAEVCAWVLACLALKNHYHMSHTTLNCHKYNTKHLRALFVPRHPLFAGGQGPGEAHQQALHGPPEERQQPAQDSGALDVGPHPTLAHQRTHTAPQL
jgi:hypothetical protein